MGRRGTRPEFRRACSTCSPAGRKVADLARDLGVSDQTIYTWRRQDRIDRGLVPGLTVGRAGGARGSEAADPRARGRARDPSSCVGAAQGAQPTQKAVRGDRRDGRGGSLPSSARLPGPARSRSPGFYAQRSRPPSARRVRHAWLTELIRQVHRRRRGTYGARRVHAELTLGRGLVVGHGAVELLMRGPGSRGCPAGPRFRRIPHIATAGDLVERQFARASPTGCGSPTSPSTRPARARCTAPSCSTPSPGGSSAGRSTASPTAALVTNALGMAIEQRATRRDGHPLRPGHPVHVLGVHPPRARLRAAALDGLGRRLLRQRR